MTPDESKKLDDLCKQVKEIHTVFYKEPGLVHEVKMLCEWRKAVKTNLTWVTKIIVGLILSSGLYAIVFYWKNSN